jgi:integrating conjugative element protein (TIGR03758 family)
MNPSADQLNAFAANGGFTADACATLLVSGVFVVLLLWGVWALRAAYVGWSEDRLSSRLFVGVLIRFVAMYLVLTFFLLS